MEGCYFKLLGKCPKSANSARITSIIKASKDRGDELPTDLKAAIARDAQCKISCHRDCVTTGMCYGTRFFSGISPSWRRLALG